ncbi:asparagine synthase (glutamine-hydrolyzing) [Micavibrio aeruginosavorus]|uniref:asparagine synthase (glutamine-hydrolyzing) n=1 Tax=Micavibrio aeruginosavorus TaxID=349221 RepID=UPI003F4AA12A
MCGVFGFIAAEKISSNVVYGATKIIQHRGPDDEGYVFFNRNEPPHVLFGTDTPIVHGNPVPEWFPSRSINTDIIDSAVGLGHRRLSILDLSPFGHQPMCYDGARYWITYNGEIYNYLELRKDLESLGHKFITETDTEVILAAYSEWGSDCLNRFNGMWAFAIYDRIENRVFLARDRFGVKPLYYWFSSKGDFYFASEIKQFTTIPGWEAVLNYQKAYDFLVWGVTDHTDETLFDRVFHISPGHYAEIDVSFGVRNDFGRIDLRRWYKIEKKCSSGYSFDELSSKFRDILKESVRLRLRSDVPVGSCLSGGLDSSSIVCLMRDILLESGSNNIQKTFSALSQVQEFSEEKWIKKVVDKTSAEPHVVCPNLDDLFDVSTTLTWHQDEPFGSTSLFAQWSVFELAAKNNVRVMLDGQGADEQLFGYHGALGIRLGSLFRAGRWKQMVREMILVHKNLGYSYGFLLEKWASAIVPYFLQNVLRSFSRRTVPAPGWVNWSLLQVNQTSPFRGKEGSVYDYCNAQMTSTNLQMLLHWEDRDSMAHSIESRVPFLDYRLVEFSMSLPDDYKIFDGVTKLILRASMSGTIPDDIRDRVDKVGFATPEEVWIREANPDLFRRKLEESIKNSKGVLNEECLGILEDIIAGRRPFNFCIWRMICFGEWMKLFSVRV